MAWVRSYDDYYNNDVQAYTIDPAQVEQKEPSGSYLSGSQTLTLTAQEGASIFYSVDGGKSWKFYSEPTTIEKNTKNILCFSVYHGAKSNVREIPMNPWAGSILGEGHVWYLIIGAAIIVGVSIVVIETNRKKKKTINNQ